MSQFLIKWFLICEALLCGELKEEISEWTVQSAEKTALIPFFVCVTVKAIDTEFTSCRNRNEK